MGSPKIARFDQLNAVDIRFKVPQRTPENIYYSEAALEGGEHIILQLPAMRVSDCQLPPEPKAFLELQVANDDLYQLLRNLDVSIVQHVYRNRAAWFNSNSKDVTMAAVEDSYRSPLSRCQDGACFRMKLNVAEGEVHTVVWESREKAPLERLQGNPEAVCIVQLRGLALRKDSICPDWVVHSTKVRHPAEPTGCLFADE